MSTQSKAFKNEVIALSKETGIPPEMLLMLAAANGTPMGNLTVERSKDKKIILPEGMSYEECITWCKRMIAEENEEVRINEEIDAWPLEGAVALMKALKEMFGWTSLKPKMTFWGPQPPAMLAVPISKTETIQVPWGEMKIPGVDGYIETQLAIKEDRLLFKLGGVVKRKGEKLIHDLANEVRRFVKEDSLYRGKPIKVDFPYGNLKNVNPATIDLSDYAPVFLDVRSVNRDELIFSADLAASIKTSIFNPIEYTKHCRTHAIPLKRGILLEGPFGTGKTLTANVTAKLCEDNGWTYVYLRDAAQLAQAVDFAKRYQPAVIFAEDIDKVMVEDRTEQVNEILNVIDGIDSKGMEIMVILTTNHIENVQQAMLRPGRLDAVISLRYPDAVAAARLIRLYGHGLIAKTEDLEEVGKLLDGVVPAVLREVVERSKLSAIGRLAPNEKLKITALDLEITAKNIRDHLKLLEPKGIDKRTNAEKLGDAMGRRVVEGMRKVADLPKNQVRIPATVRT
jgi:transitional endoplasmic reticulum ATPase